MKSDVHTHPWLLIRRTPRSSQALTREGSDLGWAHEGEVQGAAVITHSKMFKRKRARLQEAHTQLHGMFMLWSHPRSGTH